METATPYRVISVGTLGGVAVSAFSLGFDYEAKIIAKFLFVFCGLLFLVNVTRERSYWFLYFRQHFNRKQTSAILICIICTAIASAAYAYHNWNVSKIHHNLPNSNHNSTHLITADYLTVSAKTDGLDYDPGSVVSGIIWKKGYSYLTIDIRNPTEQTYSDFNMIISPDTSIIEARVVSSLSTCSVSIMEDQHPVFEQAVNEKGNVISTRQSTSIVDLALGPPYRLFCDKLPGLATIHVDIATVQQSGDVDGFLWLQDRHDPTSINSDIWFSVGSVIYRSSLRPTVVNFSLSNPTAGMSYKIRGNGE